MIYWYIWLNMTKSSWRKILKFVIYYNSTCKVFGILIMGRNRVFVTTRIFCHSVQSLSHVQLFGTPWIAACQASLSITNSWSTFKLTSIESVMPSSHLILCPPLLLLPAIPPSIRVFCNESTLSMKYDPAIPFLGIYPEEIKLKKIHVSHCSLQHCLQ